MRLVDIHTDLIGKICKLTRFGVQLEYQYERELCVGDWYRAERLRYYCGLRNEHEISLMFIDEKPHTQNGVTWFCVKEVGQDVNGDWHWFTLNQLIICE